VGVPSQGQLNLASEGTLPPLSLIIDWHDQNGEPVIHVGLPVGPWGHQKKEQLHWRVALPDAGEDFSSLSFVGSDEGGSILEIDDSELLATNHEQ